MKLLEQANQRVIEINKLMSEVEGFEDIINAGREAEVAFADKGACTTYIKMLSPEKMQELKETVMLVIMSERDKKAAELEKLLGIRKPATINPEFEKAIQEMENKDDKVCHCSLCEPDPVEEKLTEILQDEAKRIEEKTSPSLDDAAVEDVRRMYHDEAKTMKEIAAYYGVTKSQMNTYISKHSLRRTSYKNDGFMDAEVEAKRKIVVPEPLRAQNDTEKCRTCGKAVQFSKKLTRDMWPYKYRRKRNGKEETVYCCSREHYLTGKAKDA